MTAPRQPNGTATCLKNGEKEEEKSQGDGDCSLDYDYLQCTIPDIHGIPRGRMVPRHLIPKVLEHGFGLYHGIGNYPLNMDSPSGLTEYSKAHYPNATFLPVRDTARPLDWSSTPGGRRLGHVHCQLLYKGHPDPVCSRHTALRQLQRLEAMGLRFKSAFEMEFMVFEGGDVSRPMGGSKHLGNMDLLDENVDFFMDLLDCLKASGLPVEFFHNEYNPGQYEITLEPREGIESADATFLARYGIRAFSRRRGHQATFMTLPVDTSSANTIHLNHSLWTKDGKDVFFDANDPDKLSSVARHWVAGLLHHAPALRAICSPTVNCYQSFGTEFTPYLVYWNIDDRNSTIRAKVDSSLGPYLENRLSSSACNPYLVLAATIAAGLDGVERQLPCPKPGPPEEKDQGSCKLPASLEEALEALDKDVVLKEAVGTKVLNYMALLKRDHELTHFHSNTTPYMSRAERVEVDRKYYMPYM